MGDEHMHGCWLDATDRICEDGVKGCVRVHPLRADCPTLSDDDEPPQYIPPSPNRGNDGSP